MRPTLITTILVLLSLTLPATAAYRPPVEPQALPHGALVRVNRRPVLLLRHHSVGTLPIERGTLIAERLAAALDAGLMPGAVRVRPVGGELAVLAGATELVRPTVTDARAAGTTPRRLAYQWARKLQETLSLAPLTLSARSLLVP